MTKILFFSMLNNLGSGHYHVAKSITGYINKRSYEIDCQIIDILYSLNPGIEKLITGSYIWWIKKFPQTYAYVYKKFVYDNQQKRSLRLYDFLFLNKMKKILKTKKPELIICTHAFPSYIVNKLKELEGFNIPVINVYTDFFINDLWAMSKADFHFVSDKKMKLSLINDKGIDPQKIAVTGIPIDEYYFSPAPIDKDNTKLNIIISGGSVGLGNIEEILKTSENHQGVKMHILCGHNKKLYKELKLMEDHQMRPLPYIDSKKHINDLYNNTDAIVSKAGGVTISEAIHKELPIFINSVLPGQEEINLKILKEKGLVFTIDKKRNVLGQIKEVLEDKQKMLEYKKSLIEYKNELEANSPSEVFRLIEKQLPINLSEKYTKRKSRIY